MNNVFRCLFFKPAHTFLSQFFKRLPKNSDKNHNHICLLIGIGICKNLVSKSSAREINLFLSLNNQTSEKDVAWSVNAKRHEENIKQEKDSKPTSSIFGLIRTFFLRCLFFLLCGNRMSNDPNTTLSCLIPSVLKANAEEIRILATKKRDYYFLCGYEYLFSIRCNVSQATRFLFLALAFFCVF